MKVLMKVVMKVMKVMMKVLKKVMKVLMRVIEGQRPRIVFILGFLKTKIRLGNIRGLRFPSVFYTFFL